MDSVAILQKLNLSPSEAKTYLAVLAAGEARVSEVGKLTGVTRMAGYTAAEELVKKGLLSYIDKQGKKRVMAEDPARLELMLREKEIRVRDEAESLKSIMPELQTLFSSSDIKPNVRVYSGTEGIKTLAEDILNTLKRGESYVGYGAVIEEFSDLEEYFHDFVPRRVKKEITFRGIVPGDVEDHTLKENKAKRRELRYVPLAEFPFKNEINIYGNKISIESFKDKIGLIIESKQIADTQRMIFELAWRGAQIKVKSGMKDPSTPLR